jgi:hypothetical protein|tara:strand:- start:2624 stop:3757 length:1134 start_codon:yes stop_codon:yes gene_type:complete
LLTKDSISTLSPEFSVWESLVAPATGELFGKPLAFWQEELRQALSLPTQKPIILVGHQPTFFHPGILAKFIAADRLAKEIDGVVVFLVVDYHNGDVGVLQTPNQNIEIATIDSSIAMNNQPRKEIINDFKPFSSALQKASGHTVASQFANALVQLMSPWTKVHHVITASDLFHSTFGNAVVAKMQSDHEKCTSAYNDAVVRYPDAHIPLLEQGSLPVWQNDDGELRPRALLLTLLARLVACDLFVHGTGGMKYDVAMEHWCSTWLGVLPCAAVLATATMRLNIESKSLTDTRREFYSPPFDLQTKTAYLDAIEREPYKSAQKQVEFQKMHRWLHAVQQPLDFEALKAEQKKAVRRDWAFPLYSVEQLRDLRDDIYSM